MHIQLVTFTLDGITDADLRARADAIAPTFAQLPGLYSKVRLADSTHNTYGGLYTWRDRDAMQAYRSGELYTTAVRDNPAFADVHSTAFAVLDGPTRRTAPDRPEATQG